MTYSWINRDEPKKVYNINTQDITNLQCSKNKVTIVDRHGDQIHRNFDSISEAQVFHGTIIDEIHRDSR